MQLQQINRDDAEKVFISIKAVHGATISANMGVVLACTGSSVDGISAVRPINTSFLGWVGIADADIADAGYGRAQNYGYRDSVLLSHEGTSITVTIGDALHLVSGQFGLNTSTVEALSTMGCKYVICAATTTISAAAYAKGIIRCLG